MVDNIKEIQSEIEAEQPYNTADPEAVNKERKKYARTRADRLEFVKAAMGVQQGRSWFYDILNFCDIFNYKFDEDPYRNAFNCGVRNIGARILADVQEASPEKYLEMIRENKR